MTPKTLPEQLAQFSELFEFMHAMRRLRILGPGGEFQLLQGGAADNAVIDLRSLVPSGATSPNEFPAQTGNAGKFLSTDGSTPRWAAAGASDYTRIVRSATQSIPNGTVTAASFDSVDQNPSGLWSGGNPTQVIVPTAGVWSFGAEWQWASNGSGLRWVFIEFTRAVFGGISSSVTQVAVNTGDQTHQAITSAKRMSAGDYVILKGYQSSGSSLNTVANGVSITAIRLGD